MCELNLKKAFETLKISNSEKTEYTSFEKCKDNYVGKLSYKECNLFILKKLRFENFELCSDLNRIDGDNLVIILESPHKNEFLPNLIAPALGNTGINLNRYLHEIFYDLLKNNNKSYNVLLFNCVPYQCSLGGSDPNVKNKIFEYMYTKYWEDDLLKRLKKVKPSIVLVATTIIELEDKNEVKFKLLDRINSEIKLDYLYFSTSHPSVWYKSFEVKDYKHDNKTIFSK